MTTTVDTRRAGPTTGNDATTAFPFVFKVFAASDLQVINTLISTGVETVLVLNSDYSVTLNSNQDSNPGGSVTYPITGSAMASTNKLTIVSTVPYTQETDLLNAGPWHAQTVEDALDRATILVQQLKEILARSITVPASTASGVSLALPTPAATKLIGWNGTATALQNYDATSGVTVASNVTIVDSANKYVGTEVETALAEAQTTVETNAMELGTNRLINGDGRINQRGDGAGIADDTYSGPDRWYVLTQTGTIAISQIADPEAGALNGIRLTQSQAAAQRIGLAQIIESANIRDLRSVIATLAGRCRLSTTANLRYAVIEWTGAADAVTSDVVNDWTSSTYTAGNFFISANVNILAVGSVACTAATARALTALNATHGAAMNNVIAVVWSEATLAQNVTLDVWNMQYQAGNRALPFQRLSKDEALRRCLPYFEKTYDLATAPGTVTDTGKVRYSDNTAAGQWSHRFTVRKRATAPSITVYSPATGAAGNYRDESSGVDFAATVAFQGEAGFVMALTNHGAADETCGVHWAASSEL